MRIIIGAKMENNIKETELARKKGDTDRVLKLRAERMEAMMAVPTPLFGDVNAASMADRELVHLLEWAHRTNKKENASLIMEAKKRGWEVL